MLIRSKLIRPNGTKVDLGKGKDRREYHFKPLDPKKPGADHVCDVTHQADIATFLAITEGYEVHPDAVRQAAPKPSAPQGNANGNGLASDEKSALLKAVEEKTGKKPNPSTSVKKLKAMLAA